MFRKRMSLQASKSLYKRTARRTNIVNLGVGRVPRGGYRL